MSDACCASGPKKLLQGAPATKRSFSQSPSRKAGEGSCVLVWIMSASNLKREHLIGHSDPYAAIGLRGEGEKDAKLWAVSSTVNNNSSPVWGQDGEGEGPYVLFPSSDSVSADLIVNMYDEDLCSKDDTLGSCVIHIESLLDLPFLEDQDVERAKEFSQYVLDEKGNRIKSHRKDGMVTIRVACGQQSHFVGTVVCTDVDDTLKVGRHWPAGCDRLYGKGGIYPGVAAFQMELARGPGNILEPPQLVILSARPKEVEACALSQKDVLALKLERVAALEACACMHGEGDQPDWGVAWNRAQYGSVQDGTNQLSYGTRKYKSFQDRIQHFGHPSVFVADDGQGDLMAATQMACLPPVNSARGKSVDVVKARSPDACAGFAGSFIHRVFDFKSDEARLKQRHSWIASLGGEGNRDASHVEYSKEDIQILANNNIFLFYTYDEAARIARDNHLISVDGFRHVLADIIIDHLDTKDWVIPKTSHLRRAESAPDGDACKCPMSASTEEFYEQVFQLEPGTFGNLVAKAARAPITSHPGECRFLLRRLIASIEPKLEELSGTIQTNQALWQSTAPRPGKAAALVPLVLRELGSPQSEYLKEAGEPVKDYLEEHSKILYIGSPDDIKTTSKLANTIKSLGAELGELGVKVSAGREMAELLAQGPIPGVAGGLAGVTEVDVQSVDTDKFQAVVVTPGRNGAEEAAKRLVGKAPFVLLTNSEDAEFRLPSWMKDVPSSQIFDLSSMSAKEVAGKIQIIGHRANYDKEVERITYKAMVEADRKQKKSFRKHLKGFFGKFSRAE